MSAVTFSQPLARTTIRVLHRANIDGMQWRHIAANCGVHVRTLQSAVRGLGISPRCRAKIEAFAAQYAAPVAEETL